jgi:CxxC motif-containing protein (DUF1111 family)
MRIDRETTNERNTTGLFGSGLIEILAVEMTRELQAQRAEALNQALERRIPVRSDLVVKGVHFGEIVALPDGTIDLHALRGVDFDLVVRPFGAKGVAASLREFTIAALNQHHGMQAIERFGWERTGVRDFDGDGVENEISVGQLTALVAFQAHLPAPEQRWSDNAELRESERRGEQIFVAIHCSRCHIPAIPINSAVFSEPNAFNRPGAITPRDVAGVIKLDLSNQSQIRAVHAFTDLKRHNLCDAEVHHFCNEVRKQDNIATELFLTAKLWDVATSGPYGHRGDLGTLSEAILAHGGEARAERERFRALIDSDKRALIAFMRTLGRAP